jgi:hypothetical protein
MCGKPWDPEAYGGGMVLDHDGDCCPVPTPREGGGRMQRCGKCLRGLLCTACNVGIGALHHSVERLRAGIWYLERARPAVPAGVSIRPRGEDHHQAKLTEIMVREIRWRFGRGGWTKADLARRFPVDEVTIGEVIAGKTWGHLAARVPLTDERQAEIAARYQAGGIRQEDLAGMYGCSQVRVSQVLRAAGAARGAVRDSNGQYMAGALPLD